MSVITFYIDKSALRFHLQTVPFETASSPDKFVMHRGPCPLNERPLELFQMVPGCSQTFGTKHSLKLPGGKSLKITSGKSVMRQQAFLLAPRLAIRTAGRGRVANNDWCDLDNLPQYAAPTPKCVRNKEKEQQFGTLWYQVLNATHIIYQVLKVISINIKKMLHISPSPPAPTPSNLQKMPQTYMST